jgi:hypothetical protein
VSKQEFLSTQDEPEKIELELDDAKYESSKEEEAEEEEKPHTPVLRRLVSDKSQTERYSPPNFRSSFSLSIMMMIPELSGKQ